MERTARKTEHAGRKRDVALITAGRQEPRRKATRQGRSLIVKPLAARRNAQTNRKIPELEFRPISIYGFWMKLRLDLLKHLTTEDVIEEAVANVHRFNPEPLFAKTGIGSLLPASASEREREIAHSIELTRKLEQRAKKAGETNASKP